MILRGGANVLVALAGVLLSLLFSCSAKKRKTAFDNFQYERFKDSLIKRGSSEVADTTNFLDVPGFTPGIDSLDTLLIRVNTLLRREAALMEQFATQKKGMKKIPGFTPEEKEIIQENIIALDSFLMVRNIPDPGTCKGKDCILYVEIDKSTQTLFLYIIGQLEDTFKISTGIVKYETPKLNLRPAGPVLTKYTSRKFPGGNYKGMGNMPYAVFLKGGYAIHGTTPGNFSKLGTRASHGCIRLHPDNAKVFNALVKTVGLSQTWITIKDSLLP